MFGIDGVVNVADKVAEKEKRKSPRKKTVSNLKREATEKRERLSLERNNPISMAAAASTRKLKTGKRGRKKNQPQQRQQQDPDALPKPKPPMRHRSGGSIDSASGTIRTPGRPSALKVMEPHRRPSAPISRGERGGLISEDDLSVSSGHSRASSVLTDYELHSTNRDQLLDDFFVAAAKLVIQSWHEFYVQDGFEEEWGEHIIQHMTKVDPTTKENLRLSDSSKEDENYDERLCHVCNFLVEMLDMIVTCFIADVKAFSDEILHLGDQCRREGINVALLQDAVLDGFGQMNSPGFDLLTQHAWTTVLATVIPKMNSGNQNDLTEGEIN